LLKANFKSYSKINLGLAITAKRPDNYHILSSLFIPISLYDELDIDLKISDNFAFNLRGSSWFYKDIPTDKSNIMYKVAKLISNTSGINFEIDINIKKNIPTGAGLGGGSSNGSYLLKALNSLLNLNYSNDFLKDLSLKIGADCPFFIEAQAALVEGIGEKIKLFDIKESYELLILTPDVNISTKEIFTDFILDLTLQNSGANNFSHIRNAFSCGLADKGVISKLSNDLESTALKKSFKIKQAREFIEKFSPIVCMMSGSGSSVYGVFEKAPFIEGLEVFDGFSAGFIGNWFLCNTKFMRRA